MERNDLSLLGLALRGGMLAVGDEAVGDAVQRNEARLLLLASDASDNIRRTAEQLAERGGCLLLTLPCSREVLGSALGRSSSAIAALKEIGLAAALGKRLAAQDPEAYGELSARLDLKAQRAKERRETRQKQERESRQQQKSDGESRQRQKQNGEPRQRKKQNGNPRQRRRQNGDPRQQQNRTPQRKQDREFRPKQGETARPKQNRPGNRPPGTRNASGMGPPGCSRRGPDGGGAARRKLDGGGVARRKSNGGGVARRKSNGGGPDRPMERPGHPPKRNGGEKRGCVHGPGPHRDRGGVHARGRPGKGNRSR